MSKKQKSDEPFISRQELIARRGLTPNFIRKFLKPVEYDFGHRTKMYKLSEVDMHLSQIKAG